MTSRDADLSFDDVIEEAWAEPCRSLSYKETLRNPPVKAAGLLLNKAALGTLLHSSSRWR